MRVLIGEDEILQRRGLALQLEAAGFEVCGATGDAMTLVELARTLRPDVVVTDIRMPPGRRDDGLQAARRIRAELDAMPVVVLSHHLLREYALTLLGERSDGVGYLLKQRVTDVERFCADVRRVAEGGTALDPEVVAVMVDRALRRGSAIDRLTERQREVLALMAEGRTNLAIARLLSINEKSVIRHVSNTYDVLGLAPSVDDHRRVIAVVRYLSR